MNLNKKINKTNQISKINIASRGLFATYLNIKRISLK